MNTNLRIIFAGTPEFACPALQALLTAHYEVCAVYTQPDRPVGRGQKLTPSPVKTLALSAGIPVYQPLHFKDAENIHLFQQFNADVMIVVAYGMILPKIILDTPRYGCLNIHASLLPRWRGAAPIQRALIAGDEYTGVTIMHIVEKLDAGDILQQQRYRIGNLETSADLFAVLADLGAETLLSTLEKLTTHCLTPEKQLESLVTYAAKLNKSEAILQWSESAVVLQRKIRGLNPWPVAQTYYQQQVLRIWQAEVSNHHRSLAIGEVYSDGKVMEVGCGDGILRLLEVQLPNAKRLPIQAFLQAHSVHGSYLG